MQSSLCFTGQQEPKPAWMSAGTAQLSCWAGPSWELPKLAGERMLRFELQHISRTQEEKHCTCIKSFLQSVFSIDQCPRSDLLLCCFRKISFSIPNRTGQALQHLWSLHSVIPRGGWHQEGDSSMAGQWLSSKCHRVCGGLCWHPCDTCAAAAWAAEGSAVQPCLSLSAPKSGWDNRGELQAHSQSHLLMGHMQIGVVFFF